MRCWKRATLSTTAIGLPLLDGESNPRTDAAATSKSCWMELLRLRSSSAVRFLQGFSSGSFMMDAVGLKATLFLGKSISGKEPVITNDKRVPVRSQLKCIIQKIYMYKGLINREKILKRGIKRATTRC